MSGVSIAEREFYRVLLDLDDLDLASGVTRGIERLLAVTGATEAFVELRGPGSKEPILCETFTRRAGYPRTPASSSAAPSLERMHETGVSCAFVRVRRNAGQRGFTARHEEHVELFVRMLVRLSDRAIPLDLSEGLHAQRRLLDQRLVAAALEQTGGNVAEAARLLGVTRAFIYAQLARDEKRT